MNCFDVTISKSYKYWPKSYNTPTASSPYICVVQITTKPFYIIYNERLMKRIILFCTVLLLICFVSSLTLVSCKSKKNCGGETN